ncbi:MAG: succinate-semialdehyde dehydrogenase (NADP(+)) [Alphaproteobacteria bacterium CG11_big_fil_rev_8_21_14_0_20_44_7]|nr:MAG: succinate-semialdehyde dehydrogenase (NADP(+)) [Alphaproteobacteria bacterium CG11_big_fil_rev_8_21_14_0_20_44_7]
MNKKLIAHKFPDTGKDFEVRNPANGKLLAKLPDMGGTKFITQTIDNADSAFAEWKAKTAWERAEILHKWSDLILAHKQEIAKIMHSESGKLMSESIAEVEYAASFIPWSAEEAKRSYGEIIPMRNAARGIVAKEPIGVVAAITPWNFPAAMITRKTAPALAVGCTVICKPPQATPLTAIAIHNLGLQAGLPEAVFQLVLGDSGAIGEALCASKKIRKLSFTGSTEIGKKLMEQCASTMKKVTMELGGNAPFIVFDDANLEKAASGAVSSRFRNSGQTCICANRFLVQENIYDEFAKLVVRKCKNLELAPLINEKAVQKVDALVKNSKADLLCGGKSNGNFYEPTVLKNVTAKMEIYNEEIFGPVLTLVKFKTEAEAVKLANGTPYGLAGYIYTGDLQKGWRVAEQIEFGMVGINETAISAAHSPFGGYKESGIGREGAHYGIEEYLETKFISIAK